MKPTKIVKTQYKEEVGDKMILRISSNRNYSLILLITKGKQNVTEARKLNDIVTRIQVGRRLERERVGEKER